MVGTPGPANLLIMSGGAQHGYRGCLPFGLGLIAGKLLLNLAMAIGLGTLLIFHPVFASALAYLSALYMSWLALRGWNVQQSWFDRLTMSGGFKPFLYSKPPLILSLSKDYRARRIA